MADGTGIEWTEATWNPITGCSLASPGCTNCYAMQLAGTRLGNHPSRIGLTQQSKAGPVWTGEVRLNADWLAEPLRWKRPRRIFVCAHGDLFHENVPDEWIDRVFAIMALAPRHTFQVLTKRAERMRDYLSSWSGDWSRIDAIWRQIYALIAAGWPLDPQREIELPLPNVWLGVSAEDQARWDDRIPHLKATPAAVRWVSAEPLIGPIEADPCDLAGLDWLVVGGENGPRPMHPRWVRSLRDQCQVAAGVPFFFKQWGSWAPVCEMSDQLLEDIYHPVPPSRPEARRRIKVEQRVLHDNGFYFEGRAMYERPAFEQGSGAMTMFKVGKKRAGRLLDGQLHNAYPQPGAPA